MVPLGLIVLFVFILDFYVESFCISKMEGPLTSKVGATASFVSALLIAVLWDQPWAWSMHEWHHGKPGEKHLLSGGTVFSALFFILGIMHTRCAVFKDNSDDSLYSLFNEHYFFCNVSSFYP